METMNWRNALVNTLATFIKMCNPDINTSESISGAIDAFETDPSILKIKSTLVNPNDSFDFQETSLEEVVSEITNLKSTCAVGPDKIPTKILKLCTFECAPFLVNCFNNTKKTSIFATELKSANVVPVPKTGVSLSKSNYRPINILPAVSKLFERIMQKQINTYFKDKLSPLLGGYKKGYSYQHSLLRLLETLRECLDNKGIVGTSLIDLSKAFDVIDHKLLIVKLAAYGFSKGSLRLMLSYLTSRKQRVKLNQFFSE